jgi:hypothetical protein
MSQRVYLLGLGLALVVGAFFVIDWALSLRPGVTEANVRRIRQGVARREADTLLGTRPAYRGRFHSRPDEVLWVACYRGPEGEAHVVTDGDGRVRFAEWLPAAAAPPSPLLARLRAWFGW